VGIGDLSVAGEALANAVVAKRSAPVRLHLVHAYRDLAQAWLSDDARTAVEPLREACDTQLAAMAASLRLEAGAVEYHARQGPPAAVLAAVAREQGAHLIAIGASRRRAFSWQVGGIVRRLARVAPCPVLVVPALAPSVVPRYETVPSGRVCVQQSVGASDPFRPGDVAGRSRSGSFVSEAQQRGAPDTLDGEAS